MSAVAPNPDEHDGGDDRLPFRYDAHLAGEIEQRWQDRWEADGTYHAPNPSGPLGDPAAADREHLYVMDMFPYPSGAGLHVGHPLGYIATDVFARYHRMLGRNVLHPLGYDAFGLPAEQYAVQTGQHPRVTTEANIANMSRQLRRLGLGHDDRRSIATTDPDYYRWTQWIFLQIHDSWYDEDAGRARPIAELVAELDSGERSPGEGIDWSELDAAGRARALDGYRLAYLAEAPVNWCPGLGTVLANEEVTNEGRSERGNFPVFQRTLTQWMMRITAYAERLVDDLDLLDWPEPIKAMQRHWIGRSHGANVRFAAAAPTGEQLDIEVFTTRPDTLFGATYMVLAPEHPLVDGLTALAWPEGVDSRWTGGAADPARAVADYRAAVLAATNDERTAEAREKTGVFIGAYALNPVDGASIPVFIADYALMGYGTGALMAVPAHDQRDFEFARGFGLPIRCVVTPPEEWGVDTSAWSESWTGDGACIGSANDGVSLDGLHVEEAKAAITAWLESIGAGEGTVTTRLRDWLFSRQRYWGEPFPIVYDDQGVAHALPDSELPVLLPEIDDYSPRTFAEDDATSSPEPPLSRATDWIDVELDLGDGPRHYRRETNTMPNWAGSCWYELRYLDPTNAERLVDPEVERYWMGPTTTKPAGGVDLYVGGVEHAVLHLLYARFWHKILFDLGHLSSSEPFGRLFNQGYIQAHAYRDARGQAVEAAQVTEREGRWFHDGAEVTREYGKMGKSLKNVVTPDEMYDAFGADTFRLYEMSMGPLDASRPWSTRDVVGMHRFLQRVWRNLVDEDSGDTTVAEGPESGLDDDTARVLHRTIDAVGTEMSELRFNTAIAKLIELNNHLTRVGGPVPRAVAEPLVLMLAPLVPHLAEELWARLGHTDTVVFQPFPRADPKWLVDDVVEIPVQVKGKVRSRVQVPAGSDPATIEAAALADPRIVELLAGAAPKKVVVVPDRMVNLVI